MDKFEIKGNYANRMLSQYLWGQQEAPKPEEIADAGAFKLQMHR